MDVLAESLAAGRPTTIGARGRRVWIYPAWFRGRFVGARSLVHAFLLVFLVAGPWIDVGGRPGIRIDLPARRLYLFGMQFFATDGAYLLFLLGIVLFGVFFVTALFGRAWCGWACPQTVFLESLVRPIERLLEGSPAQRRKLDEGPWTWTKLRTKVVKHAAFAVIAGAIGTTVVAYFLGREGVLEAQADPLAHPAGTGFFLGITAIVLFDFAYFREQTCLVVCPYGRFQSALLDADSLAVAYDLRRGEPRGRKSASGAGDCVDCRRCVAVCPTGIDIRDGAQMECVQCMACIDACDDVMGRLGRPRGLIRFVSQNAAVGTKTRLLRPRVAAYGLGMALVTIAAAFTVWRRQPVEIYVSRQVGAPYVLLPDGRIQNGMQLRIANKDHEPRNFTARIVSASGAELIAPVLPVRVEPGTVSHVPFFLVGPSGTRSRSYTMEVEDDAGYVETVEARFLAPEGDR